MIEDAVEERGEERMRTSWLIVKDAGGPREVLMLGDEGEERTLPVFSFEEEAVLFLRLSGLGDAWCAAETGLGDLASVLADACPDAARVALDPFPETGLHGPHDLVSLPREDFFELLAVGLLARERRFLTRRGA